MKQDMCIHDRSIPLAQTKSNNKACYYMFPRKRGLLCCYLRCNIPKVSYILDSDAAVDNLPGGPRQLSFCFSSLTSGGVDKNHLTTTYMSG